MKPNIDSDEISFSEIRIKILEWWKFLLSKWLLIISLSLLGSILGLTYSFFNKPSYNARLTFVVEEKSEGGLGGYAGIASQFGLNLGSEGAGLFTGDNIIELMKSRLMIEKALLSEVIIKGEKTLLVNYFIKVNELDKVWQKSPTLSKVKFTPGVSRDKYTLLQDSILGKFYETIVNSQLKVEKLDKKLNIILVKHKSKDELFSKSFTEELVKNVTAFYIETKTQKSRANVNLLQSRADSVRVELSNALYGYAREKDQNLNLIRMQGQVPSLRKQTDIQLLTAMYTELIKNLELSKFNLMRDEPLIQIIDTPILPLKKEKFGKAKGIVLGGFLFGFFTIVFISIKRLFKDN